MNVLLAAPTLTFIFSFPFFLLDQAPMLIGSSSQTRQGSLFHFVFSLYLLPAQPCVATRGVANSQPEDARFLWSTSFSTSVKRYHQKRWHEPYSIDLRSLLRRQNAVHQGCVVQPVPQVLTLRRSLQLQSARPRRPSARSRDRPVKLV
jgi:hypothetical protein